MKKGVTLKIPMLCFVLTNGVLFNLSCVWVSFPGELIQTLTDNLSAVGIGTLYRLAHTPSAGNDSAIQKAISDTLMSTDTLNGVVACSLNCVYELLKMVRYMSRQVSTLYLETLHFNTPHKSSLFFRVPHQVVVIDRFYMAYSLLLS